MSILRLLGIPVASPPKESSSPETATVRKIVEALDRMEPNQARFLAAFAYVLSRVARADLTISPEETAVMERLVMEHGGLTEEQAVVVVQIAKHQNLLFGGTENYLVTREFTKIATREQQTALLYCLFAVSSADESVSSVEEAEIRQIADELKLEHQDFIAARLAFRQHLAVLKNKPR